MTTSALTTSPKLSSSVPTGLWLAGRSVEASSGARFDVLNPATGEVLASVADANANDALSALAAASAAQARWAATPPRTRGEILHRAWELVTGVPDDQVHRADVVTSADCGDHMNRPPVTSRTVPVMYDDRSDAKNSATEATSDTSPARCSGISVIF